MAFARLHAACEKCSASVGVWDSAAFLLKASTFALLIGFYLRFEKPGAAGRGLVRELVLQPAAIACGDEDAVLDHRLQSRADRLRLVFPILCNVLLDGSGARCIDPAGER